MLSLRTVKSDVVCGIPEGKAEELDKEEPGWKISGTFSSLHPPRFTLQPLTDAYLRTRRQIRRRPPLRRSEGRAGRVLSKGTWDNGAREFLSLHDGTIACTAHVLLRNIIIVFRPTSCLPSPCA